MLPPIPVGRASAAAPPPSLFSLAALGPERRRAARAVVETATVRADLPERKIGAPPDRYEFLLDHLPLAGALGRALGLGAYAIAAEPGERVRIDDGDGAVAHMEEVHRSPGLRILYGEGYLSLPLLPRVHGQAVVAVAWRAGEADPRATSLTRAEIHFRLRSDLLHLITRPFRRALSSLVEMKSGLVVRVATRVSEACARDAAGALDAALRAGDARAEDAAAFRACFGLGTRPLVGRSSKT